MTRAYRAARTALDLFAGPGGWDVAARQLGLHTVGLEMDAAACATRAAAGHATVRTDVAAYPTAPFTEVRGLIASPPCQGFSRAGKRAGITDMELAHQAVHDLAHGRDTRAEIGAACQDERTVLVAEPMRYAAALRPEWIALEQVPDVLPVWQQYAHHLRGWGYSTWCGVLNAADYGVPQTRRRAVLIASRHRTVTAPPPSHAEHPAAGLFGTDLPGWVSMATALDWAAGRTVRTRGDRASVGGNDFGADQPSWALTEKTRSWVLRNGTQRNSVSWVLRNGNQPNAAIRTSGEPAPTVAFGNNSARVEWISCAERGPVRIAVEEASLLQSFPVGYPWRGSRTRQFEQIGNAVPPRLASPRMS